VQVLHVAGPKGEADTDASGAVAGVPYVVLPFVDRMDLALAAADLTVCRAGASTVVEAAATGLPAVFVPLPIGNGEQVRNARPVVDAGGGLLVDDADLTTAWVTEHVVPLAADADRLAAMGAAAAGLVPRDADDRLAAIVAEVAGS
jgi:UDP-N-acetylglucosamine--N-acetylmuramyl-(pentapeptide) pyrophosphoryl-undecaprenol N-acetylglucosamine transferase